MRRLALACGATAAVVLGAALASAPAPTGQGAPFSRSHKDAGLRPPGDGSRTPPTTTASAGFGGYHGPAASRRPRLSTLPMSGAPSRWEEREATELLLAHPRLGRLVRARYASVAGRPLTSAADLRVHALIFRRHGCENHRCLQLFVWFPGGALLDIGRIVVDLASGGVRILRW